MRFWGGGGLHSREANAEEKPPLLGGAASKHPYRTIEDCESTVGPKKSRALSDDVTVDIEEEDGFCAQGCYTEVLGLSTYRQLEMLVSDHNPIAAPPSSYTYEAFNFTIIPNIPRLADAKPLCSMLCSVHVCLQCLAIR